MRIEVDQLELINATDGEAYPSGNDVVITYSGRSESMLALLAWSQRSTPVRVQTSEGTVACLVQAKTVGNPTTFRLVNLLN